MNDFIVFADEEYRNQLEPALHKLKEEKHITSYTFIEPQVLMQRNNSFVACVDSFAFHEPFVLLAHAPSQRFRDATLLLAHAQCKPRVLLKNPYAIGSVESLK